MENLTIRRFWASLTMMALVFTQFTTGVFPIPISPTDAAYAAGFFIEKERIDADEDEPVGAGDTIRYEITIRNNDTKVANARIIDQVPQYLEFESGTNSCYYESQTDEVICVTQPLEVGSVRTERITFRVKNNVPECINIENQADVWNEDPNPPSGIAPSWSNTVETPTHCPDPELEITKTVNEDEVEPGDDLRYTLRVENVGQGTAKDTVITDQIPSGLIYNDASSSNKCDKNGNTIECDIGDLDENDSESVNIYFDVDSSIQPNDNRCGRDIINQARANADNANQVLSNSVSTDLNCPAPELKITKATNKTNVEIGDEVRFTLEIENTGDAEAKNIIVKDTVPAGLTFDEGASDSLCDESGGVIECGPFDLRDGRDRSIRLVFDVNNQATCKQDIYNTASLNADNYENTQSNQVSVYVDCKDPKLDVTKTGPSTVVAGNDVTYQFTVRNTGDGIAEDVNAFDYFIDNNTLQRINAPFTFKSDTGANCSYSSAQKYWECGLGDIDPGETKNFTMTFKVPDNVPALCGTSVMNQVDAHVNGNAQTTPTSDWDKHQVHVTCVQSDTELELTKTANKTTLQHLGMVTYTLNVENIGSVTAQNVVVIDPAPTHLMFLDGLSDNKCDLIGSNVVCEGFDLAAGADRDLDLTFKVLDSAPCDSTIPNRADAEADNAPQVWSNQVDITIECDTDFIATKSVDKATVQPGDSLTYKIEVENTGNTTLKGLWIIDTIPNGLTYDDASSDNRCFMQGNLVKCGDDDILAGQTDTYTLVFTVQQNTPCNSQISNSAYVVFTAHNNLDDNTNTVHTNVECADPLLKLTKSANVNQAEVGDIIKYTLELENKGTGTAYNAFVLDDIITEFTFIPLQSSPECDKNGNTIECGPVDLSPNQNKSFVIAFEVNHYANCNSTVYNQAEGVADNASSVLSNSESVDIVCDEPEADVKIQKSGVTQIMRGTTIVYDVFVMNLGPDTAEDVIVRDVIPKVLKQGTSTFINLEFNSFQSDNSCYKNGNEVICGNLDLANGQSKIFKVAFDVPANAYCAKPIINEATVETSTFDPISANNDNDHLTTVNCATGTLDIEKIGPATIHHGDEITYTIVVTNNLGFKVTQNRMIDPIPGHLEFVSSNDNICYYENQTDEVICSEFDLNDGQSRTFKLTFKVKSTAQCNEDIINIADIWSNHGGVNPQWSNAHKTKVLCDAELKIEKTDNQTIAHIGDRYTYEIYVTNVSSSDAQNVVITDTLPDEVEFVSANAGGSYNATHHEVTWIIDVDSNDVELLTVTVDLDNAVPGDVIFNRACIKNNDCDDDTTTVPNEDPEFRISKTDGRQTAEHGEKLTYTISVTNISNVDAENVEIIDTLPDHVSFVSANRSGDHHNGDVTWEADIDAGDTETFLVTVEVKNTAADQDVLLNIVCISNECDDDTTIVIVENDPILTISKTDHRSTVQPSETLTYEIEVVNVSTVDAKDIEIIDTLPDHVSFVSANRSGDHHNGDVTWEADIDAGNSITFEVTVKVDSNAADGTFLFNYVEITDGPNDDDTTKVVRDDEQFGCVDIIKETYNTNGSILTPVTQFTFYLDGNIQTVQNDSTGRARFSNVPVGLHTVTENLPSSWSQVSVTPANGHVNVLEGGNCSTVTFKNQQQIEDDDEDFTISKTDNETEVKPGERLTYEITVRNVGNVDAVDVKIEDDLPNNVDYVSSSDGGSHSGGRVRWTIDLDAGESKTLTVRVDVDDNADDGDRILNEACVENFDCDDDTTTVIVDDDDDDSDDDDDYGEVTISVNDDPDPVDVCHDDDLEYEIRLTNSSNANREVDVIAILDSDTEYRSSSDGGDERSGDRVEWDDIRVNRNSSKTLRLRVRVDSDVNDGDTLRLRAAVSGGDEDTEITRTRNRCDDDDDDGTPTPRTDLTIDKTADRTEALPGSVASYTITIRNTGNRDISNAILTDDYPESYIVITDSGGGTDAGGALQWNLGTLRANSTTVVRYRVQLKQGLPRGTRIHNVATVRGDGLTRTDDHIIVVPTPPQTGLGGFIKGLTLSDSYLSESSSVSSKSTSSTTTVAVRPQARNSDTIIDAVPSNDMQYEAVATATAATLPAIVWATTMITGLSLGGLFGRRFLF